MITIVVFDLDDTLYDEIEYCKSGFAAAAKSLSGRQGLATYETLFNAFWRQFTAGNRSHAFDAGLDEAGVKYNDELIANLVKTYRRHSPQITLPCETKDALEALYKKYKLALLTDGFLPAQELKVSAMGIEKYFRCIIFTEKLGRQFWKPSPLGFEEIIRRFDAKPQNCAYIADNEGKDFIAPNKLGFSTIKVVRPAGFHTEKNPDAAAQPQHTINSLRGLAGLLERL